MLLTDSNSHAFQLRRDGVATQRITSYTIISFSFLPIKRPLYRTSEALRPLEPLITYAAYRIIRIPISVSQYLSYPEM